MSQGPPGSQQSNASGSGSSSSSNVPVRKECNIPGKSCWVLWRNVFEIDDKYQPIKAIGKGAYGVVCSAKQLQTSEKVAIKKISNAFENLTDARRTLREIKLLRHLKHENIIAVRDIFKPVTKDKFNDVYLVYELMDTDLHQIIRSSQALTNEHFQYFIYQILRGLKFVHTANVLHRDLKPSNLLLNASCDLKICDFGLARVSSERNFMTEYVVTRWYRAPELLLSCEHYTAAIDVWSVGCIMAELLGRRPLFPGKDYVDQLKLIIKTLGAPDENDLTFINSHKARAYIRALPPAETVKWSQRFPDADPLSIDLMEKMLKFDPRQRITVQQALQHPWLAQLHDDAAEPSASGAFRFDFEDEQLNEQTVRDLVYEEIKHYHPD